MKKILICCLGFLALAGCTDNHGAKTKAGKTFVKFANAKTIQEKAKYILNPQEMIPYMEKHYKTRLEDTRLLTFEILEESDRGSNVYLKIRHEGRLYYALLKKENNGYKLDWQAYTGYTPTNIREYREQDDIYALSTMYVVMSTIRAGGEKMIDIERGLSSLLPPNNYFTFIILPGSWGQGRLNETDEATGSWDWLIGVCPKSLENCQVLNSIFLRGGDISCGVTIKNRSLMPLFEKQAGTKLPLELQQQFAKTFNFATEIVEITPNWFCLTKQK